VEHLARRPDAIRPWRIVAIVAMGIAAAELIVLVVGGFAVLGHSMAREAKRTAVRTPTRPAARPKPAAVHTAMPKPKKKPAGRPHLTPAQLSVMVMNGNGRTGAAGLEANLVRARGYGVGDLGNAKRSDYTRSVVMYKPGFAPEAARLAHDLGISLVSPLDGMKASELGGSQLVVVVGID